jgi:hypothetical protein
MTRQRTLWTEKNLDAQITAPVSSSGLPGGMADVEIQDKLCSDLAGAIVTRTFEGFGTVTGASEKAVPKTTPNPYRVAPSQPEDMAR